MKQEKEEEKFLLQSNFMILPSLKRGSQISNKDGIDQTRRSIRDDGNVTDDDYGKSVNRNNLRNNNVNGGGNSSVNGGGSNNMNRVGNNKNGVSNNHRNKNRSQIENSKSMHGSISRMDGSKQKGINRHNSMQHSKYFIDRDNSMNKYASMNSSVLNMDKDRNFMKNMSQSISNREGQDNHDDSQIQKLNNILNDDIVVVDNKGNSK